MAGSCIGSPAQAATAGYTSFWAFGDSLTGGGRADRTRHLGECHERFVDLFVFLLNR